MSKEGHGAWDGTSGVPRPPWNDEFFEEGTVLLFALQSPYWGKGHWTHLNVQV